MHAIDLVARSLPRAARTVPMQTGVGGSHSAVSFSMIAFPTDKLISLDGRSQPLLNSAARMTLVNIWASWCGPCVSELTDIAENASALQQRGIDVVALSVDAITDQETLDGTVTLLQKLKFPYRSGVVDQALATKLQLLNDTIFEIRDPLPVPTSFLLDRKRRVLMVYKGPVSVEQLLRDIGGLKASSTEEWRSATVPFAGYWFMPPRRRHLFDYVQQLVELGFKEEAIDYVQRDPDMFTKHPYWPTLNQKLQP
ncbi:MAG: TlpA disulfide reductase family protein [Pirellulaceae bacterium]